jgi:hypothetical protein
MRTKVKGTPGNKSCSVLNSIISGQTKSRRTVGATDDEIKWQLGGQLATSEYRMCGAWIVQARKQSVECYRYWLPVLIA